MGERTTPLSLRGCMLPGTCRVINHLEKKIRVSQTGLEKQNTRRHLGVSMRLLVRNKGKKCHKCKLPTRCVLKKPTRMSVLSTAVQFFFVMGGVCRRSLIATYFLGFLISQVKLSFPGQKQFTLAHASATQSLIPFAAGKRKCVHVLCAFNVLDVVSHGSFGWL